ncbi:ribonucleotide reductase of class Ia [Salmonella phage SD-2_S15]|nr:ribonucleotide reductase of class Ia [Salmonella phage SD-2_S15]
MLQCVNGRVTKKIYETPQMAYMTIAAIIFMEYDRSVRMSYVKKFYDAVSNFDISLPTPIMAGLRTNWIVLVPLTTLFYVIFHVKLVLVLIWAAFVLWTPRFVQVMQYTLG